MNWKTLFSTLAEEWGKRQGTATPFEALTYQKPVTRHGNKGVVVFPEANKSITSTELYKIVAELEKSVPTLSILCDPRHLAEAPHPGGKILFSPDYPEVALAAIRTASWVVSFDPFISELCKHFGIPCFGRENWRDALCTNPETIAQPSLNTPPANTAAPEFGVCAVADSKFMGFFFGLVENLKQVCSGPFHVFLLALDEKAKELAIAQYPHLPLTVFLASEVWPKADWEHYQHKPIAERAYASKPRALLAALKSMKGAPVYFCDVDIHFFESPHFLRSQFGEHKLLFMPQWSDVFAWARFHGMFNSGLIGVLPASEPFLEWWADMCVPFCRVEMEKGYFTDQVFLDMGLWHFDQIGVYRSLDHNVAPWNRKTLGVYRAGRASGELHLKDHRVVKSYHAAGPDSDGYFELKFAWDQMVSFFSVIADVDAVDPLFRNTLDQQLAHWPELREAVALKERWRRRLRMRQKPLSRDYVSSILQSHRNRSDLPLQVVESALRCCLQPLRRNPPVDNVNPDEQSLLVSIQQRFAFGTK